MATCGTQIMRGRPFIRSYFNKSHTEKKGKCKFATDWAHAWQMIRKIPQDCYTFTHVLTTATDDKRRPAHVSNSTRSDVENKDTNKQTCKTC